MKYLKIAKNLEISLTEIVTDRVKNRRSFDISELKNLGNNIRNFKNSYIKELKSETCSISNGEIDLIQKSLEFTVKSYNRLMSFLNDGQPNGITLHYVIQNLIEIIDEYKEGDSTRNDILDYSNKVLEVTKKVNLVGDNKDAVRSFGTERYRSLSHILAPLLMDINKSMMADRVSAHEYLLYEISRMGRSVTTSKIQDKLYFLTTGKEIVRNSTKNGGCLGVLLVLILLLDAFI